MIRKQMLVHAMDVTSRVDGQTTSKFIGGLPQLVHRSWFRLYLCHILFFFLLYILALNKLDTTILEY